MLKFTVILAIICVAVSDKVTYDGFSLFKIVPSDMKHVNVLRDLYSSNKGYSFWNGPGNVGDYVHIMTSPELKKPLEEILSEHEIPGEVVLDNVQEAFNQQSNSRKKRNVDNNMRWENFQLLDDINNWFYELQRQNPSVVTVVRIGETYEGRNITGIVISRGSGRKGIFLEAGMQGADWISPATLTYFANELVVGTDEESRAAYNDFDWYIFPVTNPDGYEFTENSVRLWMKNRNPTQQGNVGVDISRNWNSNWGGTGSIFNPANDHFVGYGPFSEPETRHFSRYIHSIRDELVGYFSFRSYGQRLVLPHPQTEEQEINYQQMIAVGRRAMGSLSVRYGTWYTVGTSTELQYGVTGSAADYIKARYNLPMVATFLLRDEGQLGFAMNPNQLLPNCLEVHDALLAMIREAKFINLI